MDHKTYKNPANMFFEAIMRGRIGAIFYMMLMQIAASETLYDVQQITSPMGKLVEAEHVYNNIYDLYELKPKVKYVQPKTPEMLEKIMGIESYDFEIGGNKYVLFPMDRLERIEENGKRTCMGRLCNLTADAMGVCLEYSNGDKSVANHRYSAVVKFFAAATKSAVRGFTDEPGKYVYSLCIPELQKAVKTVRIGLYVKGGTTAIPNCEDEDEDSADQKITMSKIHDKDLGCVYRLDFGKKLKEKSDAIRNRMKKRASSMENKIEEELLKIGMLNQAAKEKEECDQNEEEEEH
ncbi:hypothetical protein ENBRE01_1137 [Enteropsectra breve]|nr:hypothetical protein ENBRE01_1137 [Enteropsectra breve]